MFLKPYIADTHDFHTTFFFLPILEFRVLFEWPLITFKVKYI